MAKNPKSLEPRKKVKTALKVVYLLPVLIILGFYGLLAWNHFSHRAPPIHVMSGQPFASAPITNLTANFFTGGNQLRPSGNDVFIEFRDARGALVDVGQVKLMLALTMSDAVMHSISHVLPTGTPGQYRATVEPQVGGEWTATLSFSGPRGSAEAKFPVTVK